MKKQILATLLLGALFCVPVYAAQIVAVTASGHDSEKATYQRILLMVMLKHVGRLRVIVGFNWSLIKPNRLKIF